MMRTRNVLIAAGGMVLTLAGGAAWLHMHTSRFDDIAAQAAARYSVDFHIVKALIFEESWFRPDIRGNAGEFGLMQISVAAARDFTDKSGFMPIYEPRLLEPRLNIEIGCWYLRQALDRFRDTPDPMLFALLRYNAGETRAGKWVRQALAQPVPDGTSPEEYYLSFVDFPTTREYARRILSRSRSRRFWF